MREGYENAVLVFFTSIPKKVFGIDLSERVNAIKCTVHVQATSKIIMPKNMEYSNHTYAHYTTFEKRRGIRYF